MGNRKQQILDRIRMRQEILDRINRSSLRGLVPHDFEIDSDTGEFRGIHQFHTDTGVLGTMGSCERYPHDGRCQSHGKNEVQTTSQEFRMGSAGRDGVP